MGGRPARPESVGLPRHPFLYTLDQISAVTEVKLETLKISYVHFVGRSSGRPDPNRVLARNIAPIGTKPEWRVEERELIRWMQKKGFRGYD